MPALPTYGEGLDLRLVPPAVAAWLVAWQGRLLPPELLLAISAASLVAAVGVLSLRRRGGWLVLGVALGCAAAAGAVTAAHLGSRVAGPLAEAAEREGAVTVVAVLTDDPRRAQTAGPAGRGARELVVTRVRVERLEVGGRRFDLRSPVVVLSSDLSWLPLLPSQRVQVQGRLRPPEPGDDVAAVLSARGAPVVLSGPSHVQRAAGHLRAGLRRAVEPLPAAERGLLPGLVVGDTSRMDPDLRADFRTVGLTHLSAVSGEIVARQG